MTILSQPATFTKVSLAVLLLDVYVTPFVHLYGPQDEMVSEEKEFVQNVLISDEDRARDQKPTSSNEPFRN